MQINTPTGDTYNVDQAYWKPNSKPQSFFLSLPDQIKEALYGGALGGGKTESLLWLPIVRGFYKHPKFQAIYFRESFPELEKSLIKRAHEIYPLFGGEYNGQKHCYTFRPSGAQIFFDYLEDDHDADKHDTDQYNLIVFEELTAFSWYQYSYMMMRNRTSTSELPAIIRSACNPGGRGHTWVRKRFVDPCPAGFRKIAEKSVHPKTNQEVSIYRIFVPARVWDNPDLLRNNPTYVNELKLLPPYLYEAKVNGNWHAIAGQAFEEYRDAQHPSEPANACHVVKPFRIPFYWPKILTLDWGWTHNTSAHILALSPHGRVYVADEYITNHKTPKEVGAELAVLCAQYENIVARVIDPAANEPDGTGKSIREQIEEELGHKFENADKNRVSGKQLFHEFLRWTAKPPRYIPKDGFEQEVHDKLLRNGGPEAAIKYRKLFEPEEPELNIPRLQIFEYCTKLREVIPLMTVDEKRPEDVVKIDGDDPYDDVRYGLKWVDRYLREAKSKSSYYVELGKIEEDFNKTRDMNAYYNKMAHFEEQQALKQGKRFFVKPRTGRRRTKGRLSPRIH